MTVPDLTGSSPKVISVNQMMIKMREGMKQVEKVEVDRKRKKTAAQKKKEDAKKKEAGREIKNQKTVLEMMKKWRSVGEGEKTAENPLSGNIPKIEQIVRKPSEEEQAAESGTTNTKEEDRRQEAPRNRKEILTGTRSTTRAAGKIEKEIDRKTPVGEKQENGEDRSMTVDDGVSDLTRRMPLVQGRARKTGVSSVKDLITNFKNLERAASMEKARNQVKNVNREGRVVEEKSAGRKRKVGEDRNLSSPSQKRCRTPITESKSYGESERDNISFNFFKTNTLLNSLEPEPAGGARSEDPGLPSQGVGEDSVFVLASTDSPETPARIGTVRPYRRCTASLVGDQNLVGQ